MISNQMSSNSGLWDELQLVMFRFHIFKKVGQGYAPVSDAENLSLITMAELFLIQHLSLIFHSHAA
jgi:hypothetical protein